jgi:TFIIF-interacting CTD phosphatase-like protein
MCKTLIIDNIQDNFEHTTPNNGLKISSWYDDLDDKVLESMIPFLRKLVVNQESDIRDVISRFKYNLDDYV